MNDDDKLQGIRERIDQLDQQIQELISQRAEAAKEVAEIKLSADKDAVFYRPEREAAILTEIQKRNRGPLGCEEMARLFSACVEVLREWTGLLREETGEKWPKKVTAFHKEMAVHGKYKEPCPVCGSPVQRIVYAENEANYCARCQTDGRLLADRSLSRLLKDNWPKRLEDLE